MFSPASDSAEFDESFDDHIFTGNDQNVELEDFRQELAEIQEQLRRVDVLDAKIGQINDFMAANVTDTLLLIEHLTNTTEMISADFTQLQRKVEEVGIEDVPALQKDRIVVSWSISLELP